MSEINSQALREAAEQAMHDDWGFEDLELISKQRGSK
ncbi:hypothetical protein EMN46_18420 [Ancylomarina sp. 16SWW S1-10-2]|nr:hypothetical protein [Ancylomarina sp. 16SWW S1-10-2]